MNTFEFQFPPQDPRQTAHEVREWIFELYKTHPEFTDADVKMFKPVVDRLKELSE